MKQYFYKLGKLPKETIDFFRTELLSRRDPQKEYHHIHFDTFLHEKFLELFCNTELEVAWANPNKILNFRRPVQKAFYSPIGGGYHIHRDGVDCKSALNIAISTNPGDWVRWYDDELITKISSADAKLYDSSGVYSRDTNIKDYENIEYVAELKTEVGDVYVLDTDSFHSFKCVGDTPRLIIQTKFKGNPPLDVLFEKIKDSSFTNLIRE